MGGYRSRLELEGPAEVLLRFGRPTLLSADQGPGSGALRETLASGGAPRPEDSAASSSRPWGAQSRPEVRRRGRRRRIEPHRTAPQALRRLADLDLIPRDDGQCPRRHQDGSTHPEGQRSPIRSSDPESGGQPHRHASDEHCEAHPRDVAVAVRGQVRPQPEGQARRREHDDRERPGGQAGRPASPQEDQGCGDQQAGEDGQAEPRLGQADLSRQSRTTVREAAGQMNLTAVDAEAVGGGRDPGDRSVTPRTASVVRRVGRRAPPRSRPPAEVTKSGIFSRTRDQGADPGQSAERIDVEEQQGDRQWYRHALRENRGRQRRSGGQHEPRPGRLRAVDRPQIKPGRDQDEGAAKHVGPAR